MHPLWLYAAADSIPGGAPTIWSLLLAAVAMIGSVMKWALGTITAQQAELNKSATALQTAAEAVKENTAYMQRRMDSDADWEARIRQDERRRTMREYGLGGGAPV